MNPRRHGERRSETWTLAQDPRPRFSTGYAHPVLRLDGVKSDRFLLIEDEVSRVALRKGRRAGFRFFHRLGRESKHGLRSPSGPGRAALRSHALELAPLGFVELRRVFVFLERFGRLVELGDRTHSERKRRILILGERGRRFFLRPRRSAVCFVAALRVNPESELARFALRGKRRARLTATRAPLCALLVRTCLHARTCPACRLRSNV